MSRIEGFIDEFTDELTSKKYEIIINKALEKEIEEKRIETEAQKEHFIEEKIKQIQRDRATYKEFRKGLEEITKKPFKDALPLLKHYITVKKYLASTNILTNSIDFNKQVSSNHFNCVCGWGIDRKEGLINLCVYTTPDIKKRYVIIGIQCMDNLEKFIQHENNPEIIELLKSLLEHHKITRSNINKKKCLGCKKQKVRIKKTKVVNKQTINKNYFELNYCKKCIDNNKLICKNKKCDHSVKFDEYTSKCGSCKRGVLIYKF